MLIKDETVFADDVVEAHRRVMGHGLVDVETFAATMKRSPRTIHRWIADGLVTVVIVGTRRFIDVDRSCAGEKVIPA